MQKRKGGQTKSTSARCRAPRRCQRPRARSRRCPHRHARRGPGRGPYVPRRHGREGPLPRSLPGEEVLLLLLFLLLGRAGSGGGRRSGDVSPLFVSPFAPLLFPTQRRSHRRCPGSGARVEDAVDVSSVRRRRRRGRRGGSGCRERRGRSTGGGGGGVKGASPSSSSAAGQALEQRDRHRERVPARGDFCDPGPEGVRREHGGGRGEGGDSSVKRGALRFCRRQRRRSRRRRRRAFSRRR